VLIPSSLREYAGLTRDAVVLGVSNRVEIWSQEAWASYSEQAAESFAEIAEKLVDLAF
jgi:MraZ protein